MTEIYQASLVEIFLNVVILFFAHWSSIVSQGWYIFLMERTITHREY